MMMYILQPRSRGLFSTREKQTLPRAVCGDQANIGLYRISFWGKQVLDDTPVLPNRLSAF